MRRGRPRAGRDHEDDHWRVAWSGFARRRVAPGQEYGRDETDMANTPRKVQDPTEAALSAIQDALNLRDTDPEPSPASRPPAPTPGGRSPAPPPPPGGR